MKYATTAFFVLLNLFAQAQTKTWDGGAGTNNWEDANNWNPNGVPTIINDVEIDNDSVSINANQTVKSILLESTHTTETNQAIFLQNGSTLSIFNSTGNGLELEDEARFWNAGSLIVVNATLQGIRVSSGLFENMANQGSISVSLSNSGITNEGTFQNRNNAQINILDVSQFGIDNYSTSSQFSNRGVITISNTQFGTNNEGTFFNRGDLSIEKTSDIGLVTRTYFKNFSTGNLTLDSLYSEGVFAWDDFINEGIMNIKEVTNNGIEDFSGTLNLVNSGSITISKTGENGIFLGSSGSVFTNEVGGEVLIDSTTESGINTNQKLINEGSITIDRTTLDGILVNTGGDSLINKGTLNVLNATKNGINFSGTILINESLGEITIDSADMSGLILDSKFINEGILTIIKPLEIGLDYSGLDSIINKGSINIMGSGAEGIFHIGSVLLNSGSGEINIDSAGFYGFNAAGKLINEGDIEVSRSVVGLAHNRSLDSLINSGLINISKSYENGISTGFDGVFFNMISGIIEIDSSEENGIDIGARFINEGELIIHNSTDGGIYLSEDTLINSGEIVIVGAEYGIYNIESFFLNEVNGEISIDSTAEEGFYLFEADFNNDGILRISNTGATGLFNENIISDLINNGLIAITNTGQAGFENLEGSILNTANGEIIIDSTTGSGFYNSSIFTNDGTLTISNTSYYGLTSANQFGYPDSLINNGIININNTSNIGLWHSGNFFHNSNSAEINLDSNANMALYLTNKFINDGDLNINNALGYGIIDAALNSDSVINNGSMKIENSVGVALQLQGTYFINGSSGEIRIDSSIADGVSVSKGKFNNEGSLYISKVKNGFVLSPLYSDSLINVGLIDIKESETFIIQNRGNVFLNDSCGKMKLQGTIENSATFLNKGLIEGSNVSWNFASTDSLINDGTIYLRIVPPSPLFKNNGNLIYPFKGTFSEDIKEMNVATTGLSPTHAIPTTWWADEGLSVSAGTYDAIDSSFTPNAAGLATDTLWLELDNGSCTVLMSMAVNQLLSCSTTENATFTGASSSDWHTPGNWDTGIVPDACTIVTIPASLSCTITTGRKARAYRMEVASGSVFDAELGVVLDINPEN